MPAQPQFGLSDLVRNKQNRLLTIDNIDAEGKVYVKEEQSAYLPYELEPVDPTNVIRFKPRY